MNWMEQYEISVTGTSKLRKEIICKQSYANYKDKITREINNFWNEGKDYRKQMTNGARRL